LWEYRCRENGWWVFCRRHLQQPNDGSQTDLGWHC
jgi:hypothetical protein